MFRGNVNCMFGFIFEEAKVESRIVELICTYFIAFEYNCFLNSKLIFTHLYTNLSKYKSFYIAIIAKFFKINFYTYRTKHTLNIYINFRVKFETLLKRFSNPLSNFNQVMGNFGRVLNS